MVITHSLIEQLLLHGYTLNIDKTYLYKVDTINRAAIFILIPEGRIEFENESNAETLIKELNTITMKEVNKHDKQ